jgi:transposase
MPDPTPSTPTSRRPKRMLSAEQKYEIWVKTLTGELTTVQAASKFGVDRTTVMTLRKVAKDGAIAALQAAVPGRRRNLAEETELNSLRVENTRLQATIVELSIENVVLGGKRPGARRADRSTSPCRCQDQAAGDHRRGHPSRLEPGPGVLDSAGRPGSGVALEGPSRARPPR